MALLFLRQQFAGVLCRCLQIVQYGLPALAGFLDQGAGGVTLGAQDLLRLVADIVFLVLARLAEVAAEIVENGITDFYLVADCLADIDAFNAAVVFGQSGQGDDHVLVDLEGIGVRGNGGGAGAIQPEAPARLGAHRDKALGIAFLAGLDDRLGGLFDLFLLIRGNIGQQHHLGTADGGAIDIGGLGGVFHRLDIALIQMLQTGQQDVGIGVEHVLDLNHGGHGFGNIAAEKLQAEGALVLGHAVQQEAPRGNQAVTAFLLYTGQAGEKLVGDILAQAGLAKSAAGHAQDFRFSRRCFAVGLVATDSEFDTFLIVDLAQVMVQAFDLHPQAVGRDHAPGHQIVQRRTPDHRLLAAGIHGDIAADGGGVLRGGIDGKGIAVLLGQIGNAAGNHPGAAFDHGLLFSHTGYFGETDPAQLLQLFGIDDRGTGVQRNGAAGITGAAAARNNGQSQLDTGAHNGGDFLFGIGLDHHEGHGDAPVGGIGGVRYPRQAAEVDIVFRGNPAQHLAGPDTQAGLVRQPLFKSLNGLQAVGVQCQCILVAIGALLDLVQAVPERVDQGLAAPGITDQIIFDIGIALDHPHIAKHLEQHARRMAGTA